MWDANQSLNGYVGMGVEAGLPELFQDIQGMNCLEIGYGSGSLLKYLQDRGNQVTGVDCSDTNFYTARGKGVNGALLKMDVSNERLPFIDGIFDAVFLFEVLEHVSNPINALQEAKRVAREDAIFIISHPMPRMIEGYKEFRHAFNYPGLFEKKHFDRFLMQLNFQYDQYREHSYHAYYRLLNKRYDRINILDAINLDINANDHYGNLNWDIELEPVEKGPHD